MGNNIGLCAGYGGLDKAVERLTGNKTVVYAENDPSASLVMAARFPQALNLGDMTAIDWAAVATEWRIDSLSAGFSCQDISDAGPRKGIAGERSKIWKDVAEAIRHIRPRIVFLENVAALRSRGLDVVLQDLAEIGFDARWTCFRASDIGAAHRRDRWFCVAWPHVPDADGPRLEVGGVEPAREEQPAVERGGASPQDTNGPARDERSLAASRQASRGGARPHAR